MYMQMYLSLQQACMTVAQVCVCELAVWMQDIPL